MLRLSIVKVTIELCLTKSIALNIFNWFRRLVTILPLIRTVCSISNDRNANKSPTWPMGHSYAVAIFVINAKKPQSMLFLKKIEQFDSITSMEHRWEGSTG